MRKMDLTDAVPIQMAMPTPPASRQQSPADTQAATPIETHQAPLPAKAQNDTPAANRMDRPAHTPEAHARFASTPTTPLSPPVANPPTRAPTTETTPPTHFLQLCNQLQRVEARQLQYIEEAKVF
ncbi:hypothetical protein V6N13_142056 [Hibiscus sabdariffa]